MWSLNLIAVLRDFARCFACYISLFVHNITSCHFDVVASRRLTVRTIALVSRDARQIRILMASRLSSRQILDLPRLLAPSTRLFLRSRQCRVVFLTSRGRNVATFGILL